MRAVLERSAKLRRVDGQAKRVVGAASNVHVGVLLNG